MKRLDFTAYFSTFLKLIVKIKTYQGLQEILRDPLNMKFSKKNIQKQTKGEKNLILALIRPKPTKRRDSELQPNFECIL